MPALSFGVALIFAVTVYGTGVQPSLVSIQSQSGTEVYTLDELRTVEVQGPIGTTFVKIDGEGAAAIVESPCPHKLCIRAGELTKSGEWSACMPNKVFVRIVGGRTDETDVDAAAY